MEYDDALLTIRNSIKAIQSISLEIMTDLAKIERESKPKIIKKSPNIIFFNKAVQESYKDNLEDINFEVAKDTGGEDELPLRYGNGSITKRTRINKNGTEYIYWQASVYYDGTAHNVTGKTKAIVSYKLKMCVAEKNNVPKVIKQDNIVLHATSTYGDWLNQWYKLYKEPSLRQSTLRGMRYQLDTYVIPKLGSYKLNKLTTLILQGFLVSIAKSNTRKKLYDIIKGSLRKATESNIIKQNPSVALENKNERTKGKRSFTFPEISQVMNMCKTKYKSVFYFLCCTGLRIGEFLALTDADIDYKKGYISVDKSMDIISSEIGKTKSYDSVRKIPFLPSLFERVSEINEGKSIFQSITYSGIKAQIYDAIKELKLKNVSIHSTRHTFASVCYACKVSDKQIQQMLGHSTLAMTMDTYTDILCSGESVVLDYIKMLAKHLEF